MNDNRLVGIRIKICSHFSAELAALLKEAWFQDIKGDVFPAPCNHPQLDSEIQKCETVFDLEPEPTILICGPCHQEKNLPDLEYTHIKEIRFSHCLNLIAGQSEIDSIIEEKAFIITPSWLEAWRSIMDKRKLTQKTARIFFRTFADKIVLLDTGIFGDYSAVLAEFSTFLDLPSEVRHIGVDYFRLLLIKEILCFRAELIDSGKIFELLLDLGAENHVTEEITSLREIFEAEFGQLQFCFLPCENGTFRDPVCIPNKTDSRFLADLTEWSQMTEPEAAMNRVETGIFLRIRQNDDLYGIVGLCGSDDRQLPKPLLAKAKFIARLCGVVLEGKRLTDMNKALTTTDSLTALATRKRFFELAQEEFDRARRNKKTMTLIVLDIDFFKTVNNTYGRDEGDAVINNVAECIRNQLPDAYFAGRIDGEEFAIVLPETEQRNAHVFAERLRRLVESASAGSEPELIKVTISLGTASIEALSKEENPTLDLLILRACEAMYTAKKTGRNRTVDWQNRN